MKNKTFKITFKFEYEFTFEDLDIEISKSSKKLKRHILEKGLEKFTNTCSLYLSNPMQMLMTNNFISYKIKQHE